MNNKQQTIHATFVLSPYVCFNVDYYYCGSNENPHFSTSANLFNKVKSDYNQCGQAQNSLLPRFTKAFNFFKKWDKLHLKMLTEEQLKELNNDLLELSKKYPCHVIQNKEIRFYQQKELSKQFRQMNKKVKEV